jgi:hypothetical protein
MRDEGAKDVGTSSFNRAGHGYDVGTGGRQAGWI